MVDEGSDRAGGRDAHALLPQVYRELHRIAEEHMRRQGADHTLQPTALVHEAWLRMARSREDGAESWRSETHFARSAARTMRSVLVDHARRRGRCKRQDPDALAGHAAASPLDAFVDLYARRVDLLALDEALTELARREPRQAEIVELHFFGGRPFEQVALLLDVSTATVKRDWRRARDWIRARVEPPGDAP